MQTGERTPDSMNGNTAVFGFTLGKFNDDSKEFKIILGSDIIIVSAEAW